MQKLLPSRRYLFPSAPEGEGLAFPLALTARRCCVEWPSWILQRRFFRSVLCLIFFVAWPGASSVRAEDDPTCHKAGVAVFDDCMVDPLAHGSRDHCLGVAERAYTSCMGARLHSGSNLREQLRARLAERRPPPVAQIEREDAVNRCENGVRPRCYLATLGGTICRISQTGEETAYRPFDECPSDVKCEFYRRYSSGTLPSYCDVHSNPPPAANPASAVVEPVETPGATNRPTEESSSDTILNGLFPNQLSPGPGVTRPRLPAGTAARRPPDSPSNPSGNASTLTGLQKADPRPGGNNQSPVAGVAPASRADAGNGSPKGIKIDVQPTGRTEDLSDIRKKVEQLSKPGS